MIQEGSTATLSRLWPDGRRYIGSYLRDQKHGKGCFCWANGGQYIGQWSAGLADAGVQSLRGHGLLLEETHFHLIANKNPVVSCLPLTLFCWPVSLVITGHYMEVYMKMGLPQIIHVNRDVPL